MADYTTILVLLTIILSTATTAHCSWISGGGHPPVKEGEVMTMGDGLTDIIPSPAGETGTKDVALEQTEPGNEFITRRKSSIAGAPTSGGEEFIVQGKETTDDTFVIQGKVYCDPCRIQIPTKISYPLAGTKVTLVCHKTDSDKESYRVEGVSDKTGKYTLKATGDHAEEICEIIVSESPDTNCPELMDDENHVRVSLTNKHGIKGKGRYANPLGFMAEVADPRCKEALDELGFTGV